MNRQQILDAIKNLSFSQGFYGRLLNNIIGLRKHDNEHYESLMEDLESKKFKNVVDIVLYFES